MRIWSTLKNIRTTNRKFRINIKHLDKMNTENKCTKIKWKYKESFRISGRLLDHYYRDWNKTITQNTYIRTIQDEDIKYFLTNITIVSSVKHRNGVKKTILITLKYQFLHLEIKE